MSFKEPDTMYNEEWIGTPEGVWETDINGVLIVGANSLQVVDHNRNHLWPNFRERYESLLQDMGQRGVKMVLFEGYRSKERQLWLYGQGRPNVKPYGRSGNIVTSLRDPRRHGGGTAADTYPDNGRGQPIFSFTPGQLQLWRQLQKNYGLEPTGFSGDYGHVQLKASSVEIANARKWADSGFPSLPIPRTSLKITVNDVTVRGANGYLQGGVSYGVFRPITTALKMKFELPVGGRILIWFDEHPNVKVSIPVQVQEGVSWIALKDLRELPPIKVIPDLQYKTVRIIK